MTKKHFIQLADVVRKLEPGYQSTAASRYDWVVMRDAMADFCAAQNPRFDRARWLGYIAGTNGPSGGAVKGGAK